MVVEYLKALGKSNSELVERIRIAQGLNNQGLHGYNFIVAGLRAIYVDISEIELVNFITDGDHDEQIDAIVIKNNFVDIYDFKGNLGYGVNDIRLFVDSIRNLIFGNGVPDPRNQRVVDRVEAARVAIDDGADIRIRVLRMNPVSAGNNIQELLEELNYNSIKEYKIYSGNDIVNEFLKIESSPTQFKWSFNLKTDNVQVNESQSIILRDRADDLITSLYCRINLKTLIDLYYSHFPHEAIFESNVRSLQNERTIKTEMMTSLSSVTKAKEFHKLHNGITIVGDAIECVNDTRFRVDNPQIVNGCQTITNIAIEFIDDRESNKLKNGSVLCKIFKANKNEVERICLASNSQVSINPWDLRTNDAIQIKIESYLKFNNIKYNRKAKNRGTNDLTFIELGQWLYSAIHENPMASKNKRRSIFDSPRGPGSVYHTIFNENILLKDILQVVVDGIFIRNHIKTITAVFEKQADFHFLAGFYMLRNKNWKSKTKFYRIRAKIRETINVMDGMEEGMKYDKMFAKKAETWQDLRPRIQLLV
jgi:hypothetical protein